MICQNCGTNLPNEARFCAVCGSPVAQATPNGYSQANNLEPAPMLGGNANYAGKRYSDTKNVYGGAQTNGYQETPAYTERFVADELNAYPKNVAYASMHGYDEKDEPRKQALAVLKSPLFLITGISWLIGLILSFVSGFVGLDALSGVGVLKYLNSEAMVGVMLVWLLVLTPQFLAGIGLIVASVKARSGRCGGLGAVKAAYIIILVLLSIFMTIVVIGAFVGWSGIMKYGSVGYGSSYLSEAVLALLVVMLLVVAVFVMMIVFCTRVVSSMSVLQRAINNNVCYRKSSIYAVVMCFIIATFGLFSVFSNLMLDSLMPAFASLFGVVNYILFGIAIAKIRKVDISTSSRSAIADSNPAGGGAYPRY